MSVNEKMTAIADAIRSKTGGTEKMNLDTMKTEVDTVYEAGKEEGKQSAYDDFWDIYQANGARTDYVAGFAGFGWTTETYKPKYPLQPTNTGQMYMYAKISGHIDVDTSQNTNFQQMFQNASNVTSLGVIDTRKATAFARTFQATNSLATIEKLILKDDGSQTFSNAFLYAYGLVDIVIEGVIGQNGLSFSNSTKLSHDSLMSIINALQTKTSGTWTVTLGSTNLAKLTDTEKKIATDKGWTLV